VDKQRKGPKEGGAKKCPNQKGNKTALTAVVLECWVCRLLAMTTRNLSVRKGAPEKFLAGGARLENPQEEQPGMRNSKRTREVALRVGEGRGWSSSPRPYQFYFNQQSARSGKKMVLSGECGGEEGFGDGL